MAENGGDELKCPRCQLPLQMVRTSFGVFWSCKKCGGRAVGVELLRRTFTPESINPLWLHAIRGEGKSGCRCPSCGNAMTEVSLSDEAGVRVDVCRLCHFVWFDMYEVENLQPRMIPDAKASRLQKEGLRRSVGEKELPETAWKKIAEFLDTPV